MKNTANLFLLNLCLIIICSLNLYSANNSFQNEFDKLLNNKNTTEKFKILQDTITESNNNEKSIFASHLFLNIAKIENKKLIPKAYLNIGSGYWNAANYRFAVENMFDCIKTCALYPDTSSLIDANIYLGLIHDRFEDSEKHEYYIKEALRLSKLSKDTFKTAVSYWNLSCFESKIVNNELAMQYADLSLSTLVTLKDKNSYNALFGFGLAYYYKAGAFNGYQMYDSAIYYYQKSIMYEKKINNISLLAHGYSEIAKNYNSAKYFKNSLKYSFLGIEASRQSNNNQTLAECYEYASIAYRGLNNSKLALDFLLKSKAIRDSIIKTDVVVLSAKLELKFIEERHNTEIENRNKYDLLVATVFIIIIIFLILISFIIYYRYRLKSKYGKELSELNATKDKFFTIISHDLKTPVSGFHNLAVLLNDYYPDFTDAEKIKHLNSLKESSGNILKLLENLLTWARVQTNRINAYPGKLDMNNLLNNEILVQTPAARKKNISIEPQIEAESFVYADEDMIGAVVRNLLSNAVKYTYPDGVISIRTEILSDSIKIEISDNGIGIREEDKHKLFRLDLKHSTNGSANEKGTGLGLNLCKEFVERNNGTITFESEFGKGSTFVFTLPKG